MVNVGDNCDVANITLFEHVFPNDFSNKADYCADSDEKKSVFNLRNQRYHNKKRPELRTGRSIDYNKIRKFWRNSTREMVR